MFFFGCIQKISFSGLRAKAAVDQLWAVHSADACQLRDKKVDRNPIVVFLLIVAMPGAPNPNSFLFLFVDTDIKHHEIKIAWQRTQLQKKEGWSLSADLPVELCPGLRLLAQPTN